MSLNLISLDFFKAPCEPFGVHDKPAENITYFPIQVIGGIHTLSMTVAQYFLEHPQFRDTHVKEVNDGNITGGTNQVGAVGTEVT